MQESLKAELDYGDKGFSATIKLRVNSRIKKRKNQAVLKSEADRLRRVIVCTPNREYYRIGNLKEHNIYEVANQEKALFVLEMES